MARDQDARIGTDVMTHWPGNVISLARARARRAAPPAPPMPEPVRDRRLALMYAPSGWQADRLADWLSRMGGGAVHISDRLVAPEWIAAIHMHFQFALLDRDLIADTTDLYDFCGRLRALAPRLPLILISGRVRGDDLSLEQRLMCDATLRVPVSLETFCAGIAAALRNNTAYRQP